MGDKHRDLEAALLSGFGTSSAGGRPLFILGSPRTGSTFLYQAMAAAFELPFVANLTNDLYAETPIVGLSIQAAWPQHELLSADSRYGKTKGPFQPSEGSGLMRRWFGGGHPSELVSREVLADQVAHIQETLRAADRLFGRPLLIKNAWNCFRISALARLFPQAAFIWIRRDIEASALSDLNARYAVQGDPLSWNSATPRNVDILRTRPYWEQVVENQAEFARAITDGFSQLAQRRTAVVWYEDLCADPSTELDRLAGELDVLAGMTARRVLPVRRADETYEALGVDDRARLAGYLASQEERLFDHVYRGRGAKA
jgi:hypothetical protein